MSLKRYLLDVRQRKTLIESFYVDHLHSTTRFFVAHPKDSSVLLDYIENEASEFFSANSAENLAESLSNSIKIMVTDCFEVCGLIVGQLMTKEDNENLPELKTASSNEKFLNLSLLHVSKDYQNANIETQLLKELFKLSQKSEVNLISSRNPQIIKLCEQLKAANKLTFTGNEKHIVINLEEQREILAPEQPTLPEAYKLTNAKRRVLGSYPAKPLGRSLEYVVAVPQDEDLVRDFLSNEYFRQTAVTRTLQCRREDGLELITRFKPEVLHQGHVFLAHDQGYVCGLAVNHVVKVNRPNPPLDENIPDDFTSEIEKQNLVKHLGSKVIRAICKWMDNLSHQMMPEDCKEFFVLDMLTVRPGKCKIGWKLWYESLKYSQELGFQIIQSICTAVASNRLASKFGMRKMIEFPYIQLKYKGQRLFEDGTVYDGGKCICMWIGKSEELNFDP